ncbi:MAG: hypothetical protein JRD94_01505 [Deltaproteobacteria bacterium]|nr:hypothetical protein [Deltaproteobacteria bacterium]
MTQTKQEIVVGYQGTEGAYSQLAAKHHFAWARAQLRCVGYHSFREMLEAVKAGEVDVAVLPIENSIAGSINDSYDLLADAGLSLVGEEFQPIAHCLIGAADVPVADIRRGPWPSSVSNGTPTRRKQPSPVRRRPRCTGCRSCAEISPIIRRITRGW